MKRRPHEGAGMRWEELTSEDIRRLAEQGYLPILPVGSLETHGPHLPLGTDTLLVYQVALEAAKREKAVVLPPLFYAYAPENRHFPGTISLSGGTLIRLLEEICDEIWRNGFDKMLILNGHGGNARVLRLFLREVLERGKPYQVYAIVDPWILFTDEIERVRETKVIGHAGEIETSLMLHVRPELCRLERVRGAARLGTPDIKLMRYLETPVDWICYAVEGFVGDPRAATADKGRRLFEVWVRRLVEVIRAIREDRAYSETLRRYFEGLRRRPSEQ